MKVDEGIYMLEIAANVMGTTSMIYPTLLWDKTTAVLIDAGYPGQLPLIRDAFEKEEVPFDSKNLRNGGGDFV